MTPLPKRALVFAVLARVSTRDQLAGHSIRLQIEAGREYARRNGATDVRVYDGDESATKEERDILKQALTDAEGGKFGTLVVQDLSRLSRNPAVMFDAMNRLSRAGVALHDLNGPIPFDTAAGEFRIMIESVVGRYTARQGAEKSLNARISVLNSGGLAAGRPPWGRRWNRITRRIELIPERVHQLKQAYRLIVNQKKSLNQTARILGIPISSLRKAISQASRTRVIQHLGGREFKLACPPILSAVQQQRLEGRMTANSIVRPNTRRQYLLQGLVRCSECGATLTGQTQSKDGKSYSVYRHPPRRLRKGCVWHIPVELLDDDVIISCANAIHDGNALRHAIEARMAASNSGAIEIRDMLTAKETDIERVSMRLDRILDRILAFDEASETRKRLEDRAKREEVTLTQLRSDRDELIEKARLIGITTGDMERVASQLRSLYWGRGVGANRAMTFEQRRDFVRVMVGRLTRQSALGIFVSMRRPKGGSKKNVTWRYKLVGDLILAENRLGRNLDFAPDLIEIHAHSPEQVASLAAIAESSRGIKVRPRSNYMQSFTKYS